MPSLRTHTLRLAANLHPQSPLRKALLEVLGGEFTEEEWKRHKRWHPGAKREDHTITKGPEKGKGDGDKGKGRDRGTHRNKSRLLDAIVSMEPGDTVSAAEGLLFKDYPHDMAPGWEGSLKKGKGTLKYKGRVFEALGWSSGGEVLRLRLKSK